MTRFNSFDHDDALGALHNAPEAVRAAHDQEVCILNQAAGTFACNVPSYVTRREFDAALATIRRATKAAI